MAGWEFTNILNWDGVGTASSDYTDVTLEAQSPGGTAFTILNSAAHYLYLGHDEKFDMAVFDVQTGGSMGALTWEYYNGSAWTEFIPGSGRYELDPDDNAGTQYDFNVDGAELFPINVLKTWTKVAINSSTKYWVRVTAATVGGYIAPTIKRIQMRQYTAYCTTQEVFEFLQLQNVLGTTDFTDSTVPTKNNVERYINEAQAYIDMNTRKSWRPAYVQNEYHQFNINGIKLDKPDPYKVIALEIWNGANWDRKTQGRTGDYFLVPDTGLIHFSRFFLLPARFQSYNAPIWRWGGGEFTMPLKITYLAGRDVNTDWRQGGVVQDISKKLTAIEVMRSADYGNITVSGMDRIQQGERINQWTQEIEDKLDFMTAFEVF